MEFCKYKFSSIIFSKGNLKELKKKLGATLSEDSVINYFF